MAFLLVAPKALILSAPGINCDRELARTFELAGASPELVHLNRILADSSLIDRYDLIGLPGGFSYGDAVGAGRIAATLMREALYGAFVSCCAFVRMLRNTCNSWLSSAMTLGTSAARSSCTCM